MNFLSTLKLVFNSITKPKQHLLIREIPQGQVIDIGGGGEGVIAQVGGARIVAIDKYMSEIHEASPNSIDSLWMVADATQLPFNNHSLDNATAFFSCMYMPDSVKERVFRETSRVLKSGGEFWIWDVNMSSERKLFAIRLKIDLPDTNRKIETAYGVKAKDQSAESICRQLQAAGFEGKITANHKHWYLIKAKKIE